MSWRKHPVSRAPSEGRELCGIMIITRSATREYKVWLTAGCLSQGYCAKPRAAKVLDVTESFANRLGCISQRLLLCFLVDGWSQSQGTLSY